VIATFSNGAITPEMTDVPWTVVSRAALVGTGFGEAAARVCAAPPLPQPVATITAAISSGAIRFPILTGRSRLRRCALEALFPQLGELRVQLGALLRREDGIDLLEGRLVVGAPGGRIGDF
jgi:hypothetical protein